MYMNPCQPMRLRLGCFGPKSHTYQISEPTSENVLGIQHHYHGGGTGNVRAGIHTAVRRQKSLKIRGGAMRSGAAEYQQKKEDVTRARGSR